MKDNSTSQNLPQEQRHFTETNGYSLSYQVSIVADNQFAFSSVLSGPLEMGRQQPGEPAPFRMTSNVEEPRLIVATASDLNVSRRQLRVQVLAAGRIELVNLSSSVTLTVVSLPVLGPGQQTTTSLPCTICLGTRMFVTFSQGDETANLQELPEATVLPGRQIDNNVSLVKTDPHEFTRSPEPLVRALQTVMDVFLSARNETELFSSAIDGALALIGFDTARVMREEDGVWRQEMARSSSHRSSDLPGPSQQVLQSVRLHRRTFWDTQIEGPASASLTHVNAVIGAPILDAAGLVIGILYGDRRRDMSAETQGDVTPLDARLMELLACGVASGLARLQQQKRAEQMRAQFAQFFTPELAAELEQNPGLLQGQDADVSLLFCDIRGFSRISERIGATETFNWIHDVMDVLSDCILSNGGVLIDYIGDELMAMWGAPRAVSDHAEQACNAATDILAALPALNARWQATLGEEFAVAIGINSGMVKVGNAGSRQKFKYSPLGNAVNLASRVVGATRYLNTPALITGTTSARLPDDVKRRKLCDAQVVNMDEPVELFELMTGDIPDLLLRDYERSLTAFEKREFRSAAHLTAQLLEQFPDDGPSLVLLSRAVQALVDGPKGDHPIWRLPSK